MTTLPSRNDMLADLADAVNELCEPRHHSEVIEVRENGRNVRRRKISTFPSLIDELVSAMAPGAGGDDSSAGFESRPAAELEPINVMAMIRDQSATYAGVFDVKRKTLRGRLHGLVGAAHTDMQLHNLLKDARTWVKRARLATGWDMAPLTLNMPCPYCWRKHTLTITADLQSARCSKCSAEWDEGTIGLLGQMLTANAEVETMTTAKCDSIYAERRCYRLSSHTYEHTDSLGRWWYTNRDGQPFTEVSA